MDAWVFPVGTKAWKEFRVDGKLVETRLLWKRSPAPGVESWWKAALRLHALEGGIDQAIVPGEPERSQVYVRMTTDDLVRMPPKGTKRIDPTGSAIVGEWIRSLPPSASPKP